MMKVSNSWKLGHVLQFAKCDSSKKFTKGYQDNYVAVSTKEVRVLLCSWYETFDGDNSIVCFIYLRKVRISSYQPLESYICLIPKDGIEAIHDNGGDENSSKISPSQQTVTYVFVCKMIHN